eukprot:s1976_g5.t4
MVTHVHAVNGECALIVQLLDQYDCSGLLCKKEIVEESVPDNEVQEPAPRFSASAWRERSMQKDPSGAEESQESDEHMDGACSERTTDEGLEEACDVGAELEEPSEDGQESESKVPPSQQGGRTSEDTYNATASDFPQLPMAWAAESKLPQQDSTPSKAPPDLEEDPWQDPWQVLEDREAMAWAAESKLPRQDSAPSKAPPPDLEEDPWQVLEDREAMAWAAESKLPQQDSTPSKTRGREAPPDVEEDPWQVLEDREAMAWVAESKLPQQDSTPSKTRGREALPDVEEDPWQVLEDREAMAWAAESKLPQQDSTPSKVRGREAPPDVEEDPWQVLEDRDAMAWAAESKLPQQDSAPSKVRAKKGPPDVEEDPWQVLEDREAMAWAAESKLPQQDSSPSKARGREAPRDLEEDPWQVLEDREAMAWAAESKLPQQDSTPSKARGREAPPDLEEEDLWRVLDRNLGSSWTQQDDVRTDKLSDDPDVDAAQEQSEADAWQVLERQEAALRAEASSRMQENETRLTDSLADQDLRVAHEQLHERKQSLSVDLPIDALREEILQAVRAERVTILVGATGCGKSTRLPQFLMDEPGAKVLVTQPRRVAAVEIARRVASERGERIGQNVGYRISGETVRGSGKLQFATIGYVLTWFLAKPEHFGSFTHVVIDEVHERAADMEMFLLLTKLLMYFFKRPKVVLMSATLQPEEFGNYFSDFVCRGGTAALSVSGRTFPVQEIFLDMAACRSLARLIFLLFSIGFGVDICFVNESSLAVTAGAWAVKVRHDLAYMTGYLSNELVVVNISDPLRLELVGSVQSDTDLLGPTGLALEGELAFVALELSTLAVVNISDPQRPQIVGILDESSQYPYSYSVACDGELVYTLSYDAAALLVINVSTPSQPHIIGKVVDVRLKGAGDLLLLGDIAWVVGADSPGLAAVNISLPTQPVVISAVQDATYLDGAYGIAVQGDFAYVAGYYSHSLAVINISDPQEPILLGAIKDKQHLYGAYSVTVDGDEAYVPCLDGKSVAIINISVPSSPELACVASEVIGGRYAARAGGYTYDDLVSDYQDLLPGTVYSLVEAAAEQFQRAWEDGDLESPSVLEGLPELAVQLVPFFAKKDSTLLVFMPGLLELSNLSKMFTPEALKSFPTSHRETSPSNYEVFVLHSMVPRSEQERVFKQPSDGKCHIVLASNIAESSITFLKLEMNDLSGNYFPENQHPWRSVRLSPMQSAPLLKFENERAKLFEEGLAVLEALPGPVCPIAFVGDGRSGKSFLASKLVGAGTFREDDSDEAVTEGIDIATMSCHPGHLLILDCEGGNNAMSKSHSIVTVVGALFATALIFVTDGKASEAAVEALGRMLEERALIKCDGTGSLQAQTLLFVVNQNRLRYGEDALEKILAADHGAERKEIRTLISNAYPEHRRQFFTIPVDNKKDFEDKWESFHGAMRNAAVPLKMGKLWMTGSQVVHMLRRVEEELRTRGKVSLPSLHRHVILDGWLKPTVGQVLQSRMDKLLENFSQEELATQKVGSVDGSCTDCQKSAAGWLDPDVEEFFCEDCWRKFSPKVLKCCFCGNFHPWILGRVEKVTKMWHCNDCLMQLGIEIPHAESAPRVTAVIDFALRREPVYDHNQGLTCLTTSWCSQASARQRSGRAGRTQPGIAIRLVTRSFFEGKMPEFDMPEILRTSTAKLFLRAKKLSQVLQKTSATFSPDCPLDLRSARSLIGSLPQPPKMKLLKAAVKELAQTSALAAADEAAEITSLGSFCAVSTWYSQEQLVAEIEMLRSSASIAEEEAPIVQKGTEEPSKENPAELLQANAVNYGEFSEDPFSEDVKHDDDPPSFLPVSSMDHASQGSWMGARPYDDEDVVPAQSPVPCGSPHGELAEPSAEPVADAPGMRMPGPGLEFRRQEKVLAPELPGSIAEDSAGSEGAWKGPGAEQPEVPPKAEEDSSPGTGVAAEEELEPATEQEQSSQLEVPEPKDSDLHGSTQVGTAGNMDEAPSAVEADVAMEADPGVELAELREQIFELQEAVASKDQTVAAQQQMLEGKSNDLKALEDQIALLQATVTDLKASIAEQPGNLQEPCWPDISRIVSSCLQERLKAAECRENDHMIQSLQVELSRSLSDKAASQQHWEEQVLELKRVVAEKDAEMTALRTSQLGRQEEDLT